MSPSTFQQLLNARQAIERLQAQADEARDLAREIKGHTTCGCFERRLPKDHWLFWDRRTSKTGDGS